MHNKTCHAEERSDEASSFYSGKRLSPALHHTVLRSAVSPRRAPGPNGVQGRCRRTGRRERLLPGGMLARGEAPWGLTHHANCGELLKK
jgi:hypothetical protein